MFPHLKNFNLKQWIDENRGSWGQRRVIWEDSDFIAFVTRGPNSRKDFHIDPGDEMFYQLEGELNLHYMQDKRHEVALLKAGGQAALRFGEDGQSRVVLFEGERGLKVKVSGQPARTQQPALFDFARRRRDALLTQTR